MGKFLRADHLAAARRLPSVGISKLFCRRLQPLPMAPSVKTFPDSDRREPPNSRGMVAGAAPKTPHWDSQTNGTFGSEKLAHWGLSDKWDLRRDGYAGWLPGKEGGRKGNIERKRRPPGGKTTRFRQAFLSHCERIRGLHGVHRTSPHEKGGPFSCGIKKMKK